MAEVLRELLLTLIYLGILTLVPILIFGIKKGTSALLEYIATKTDNEIIHEVLTEIANFVTDAVTFTMQTYVDSLKKSGEFTEEAQKEAFELAYDTALKFISQESKEMFESVYGDLDEYLKVLIESKVKELKMLEVQPAIELQMEE